MILSWTEKHSYMIVEISSQSFVVLNKNRNYESWKTVIAILVQLAMLIFSFLVEILPLHQRGFVENYNAYQHLNTTSERHGPKFFEPKFFGPKFFWPKFFWPKFLDPNSLDPNCFDPNFLDPKFFDLTFLDPKFFGPEIFGPKFFGAKIEK